MKASSGIDLMVSLDRDSAVGCARSSSDQLRESDPRGHAAPRGAAAVHARAGARARRRPRRRHRGLRAAHGRGLSGSRQGAPTRVARACRRAGAGRGGTASPVRRASTSAPARPTSRSSRAPRGPRPCARGCATRPTRASATATRAAPPSCAAALATYLGRVRGVAADPETVMVTSGLTQGLALTCRALAARGVRRIAVEEPGSADLRAPLAAAGLEWVAVDVDGDGLDVAALERSDVGAVLVTPAHQYPTGVVLAPQRRAALLAWAARATRFVLEDDYDAEYRYDRPPVGALQGLDPRARRLRELDQQDARARRCGSAGSSRRRRCVEAIEHEKATDDRGTPVLDAARARRSCSSAARSTATCAARGWSTAAGATRSSPRSRVISPSCSRGARPPGCTCSWTCPTTSTRVRWCARRRAAASGSTASPRTRARPGRPGVILGYGRIAEPAIERGVRALTGAIERRDTELTARDYGWPRVRSRRRPDRVAGACRRPPRLRAGLAGRRVARRAGGDVARRHAPARLRVVRVRRGAQRRASRRAAATRSA